MTAAIFASGRASWGGGCNRDLVVGGGALGISGGAARRGATARRGAPAGASVSVRVELASSSSSSVLMARAEAAEHDEGEFRRAQKREVRQQRRSNGWPVS